MTALQAIQSANNNVQTLYITNQALKDLGKSDMWVIFGLIAVIIFLIVCIKKLKAELNAKRL